jgi:ribosomal protein L24E
MLNSSLDKSAVALSYGIDWVFTNDSFWGFCRNHVKKFGSILLFVNFHLRNNASKRKQRPRKIKLTKRERATEK